LVKNIKAKKEACIEIKTVEEEVGQRWNRLFLKNLNNTIFSCLKILDYDSRVSNIYDTLSSKTYLYLFSRTLVAWFKLGMSTFKIFFYHYGINNKVIHHLYC
jgi:hypothetical protein